MQRWEQVYNELQRKAEKIGFGPPTQIGGTGSQVFEFRIGKEPALLLAFRDLARKEDYKVKNRLWAEGLDLVLERFDEISKLGKRRPQAAAIVIDNIGDAFVVVMIDELIQLYRKKGALGNQDGHRHLTFNIQIEPDGYYLQMPYGRPPVLLSSVNSVNSLVLLLKAAKRPESKQ